MTKQKTMLDHMIENLGPDGIAELTDMCQERFPDIAATFAQRAPNRRETWMIGLMAGHTWRVQVPYKEFYNAFRVGALTDTYSDSTGHQILKNTLDVCCPGWETITVDGELHLLLPKLEDVRASCEKAFGKISWRPDDEEAMIPIRQVKEEEAAAAAKKKEREGAMLEVVMGAHEAKLYLAEIVRAKESRLEGAYRAKDREAAVKHAKADLMQAQQAHGEVELAWDNRLVEQMRRFDAGEDLLKPDECLPPE